MLSPESRSQPRHPRAGSLPLAAALFLLGGLAIQAGIGCGEDFEPSNGSRPPSGDGGVFVFDAPGEVDPAANCPTAPPKEGENCPGVTESKLTCTLVVDVCRVGEMSYDITVDYCCGKGGTWIQCGTNTTPCDNQLPGAPDAGAEGDAAADAID